MPTSILSAVCSTVWLPLIFLVGGGVLNAAESSRPNIVVILADDMGYGDMGCMGSQTLQTPNLDRLAESGVLCSQAYVTSAVCSPSRAGLLTGRDPRRFGYEGNMNASAANYATRPELLGLPISEKTLGDHLGAAGYATALIGKWHLGMGEMHHPNRRGFDHFCGMLTGGHHYFPTTMNHVIERNGQRVEDFSSEYLTDFFTDEGLRFIDQHEAAKPDQPWFVFFSYNAPHTPMHATEADLARFANIENQRRRTYAAMMFALDRGVGRIREHLEASGQWDNTLLVFFSDNGGATNNGSWNGPLRGVKGSMREGGIRVPMIWTWPAKIPAGTRCDGVTSSLDLLPTFCAAAGAEPLGLSDPMSHEDATNRKRMNRMVGPHDGIDMTAHLIDGSQPPARRLHWRLQGQAAILDGSHKLVRPSHRPAELFNVANDVSESDDLSAQQPERRNELFRELGAWESMLTTVPLWDSSPFWSGQSAKHYDAWEPRPEPPAAD
ncbi:sulfatase-like hydrolase/transferase [Rhodopirellula sp. P2]|uniref:sulfatase-like hydrolase/transferase n=1 Tax=Rhodopirellula sp. P2 TaxID=2127060 RepID=UPI002368DCF9|nr:sulfatase-like hydrolase/transferase [Rhodopirellula sp. P2]WDQ16242.1 sulfatase-like hydrolase/transferase [Rhodopirellula sp. P2]